MTPFLRRAALAVALLLCFATAGEARHLWAALGALSPDGRTVAAVDFSTNPNKVRLYDASTGKVLGTLGGEVQFSDMAFSPDSRRLAVGFYGDWLGIFDGRTGKQLIMTTTGRGAGDGMLGGFEVNFVSADEVATVGYSMGRPSPDPNLRVWSIARQRPVWTVALTPDGGRRGLSPDGKWAAEALASGQTRLVPRSGGAPAKVDGRFQSFVPGGVLLRRQERLVRVALPPGPAQDLGVAHDAVAGPGGRLALLAGPKAVVGGVPVAMGIREPDQVQDAIFAPDGKAVLLVSRLGQGRYLRLPEAKPRWSTKLGAAGMDEYTAQFTPDGKLLLLGSVSGGVRLVDAGTGKEIRRFTPPR